MNIYICKQIIKTLGIVLFVTLFTFLSLTWAPPKGQMAPNLVPLANDSITTTLSIYKSGPGTAIIEQSLTYTLSYFYTGPMTTTMSLITVTDILPAGSEYISAIPTPKITASNALTWEISTFPLTQTQIITLMITSPATPNILTNTAFITSSAISTNTAGTFSDTAVTRVEFSRLYLPSINQPFVSLYITNTNTGTSLVEVDNPDQPGTVLFSCNVPNNSSNFRCGDLFLPFDSDTITISVSTMVCEPRKNYEATAQSGRIDIEIECSTTEAHLHVEAIDTEGVNSLKLFDPTTNVEILDCGSIMDGNTKYCGTFRPGSYRIFADTERCGTFSAVFDDGVAGARVDRRAVCN